MEPKMCRISEVAKPSDNIIIVSLQQGDLVPGKTDNVKCGLFAHKQSGKRAVVMDMGDDRLLHGYELEPKDVLLRNVIAVRNKKTNKVRVVSTDSFVLSRVTEKRHAVSVSEVTEEDRHRLGMKFGSKRLQQSMDLRTRVRPDDDILKMKLTKVAKSVMIDSSQLELGEKSESKYLPPCCRDASTVAAVYNLYDLVSREELASLEKEAEKVMKCPQDYKSMASDFFGDCVQKLQARQNNQEMLQDVCVLLYAEMLVTFVKKPLKEISKTSFVLCPYSEIVGSKIVNTFTISSASKRLRPAPLKDSAICYIVVLGLLLLDFQLDLEPLSKSVSVASKRLVVLSHQIGAVSQTKAPSTVVLKVPLPSLKSKPFNLKRN